MSEPRSWTIANMPAGIKLVTSNVDLHRLEKASRVAYIREQAYWVGKAAKIPRLERANVVCEYRPPAVTRLRDGGNWWPSFKPMIDGALVDTGVLPDDNSTILENTTMRIGPVDAQAKLFKLKTGRLVLTVTEILPVDGGG